MQYDYIKSGYKGSWDESTGQIRSGLDTLHRNEKIVLTQAFAGVNTGKMLTAALDATRWGDTTFFIDAKAVEKPAPAPRNLVDFAKNAFFSKPIELHPIPEHRILQSDALQAFQRRIADISLDLVITGAKHHMIEDLSKDGRQKNITSMISITLEDKSFGQPPQAAAIPR